ncbi:LOW QUALITY PROTEIN: TSC22 domain family protein 2 [Scleropages formosus]|uniref:LOW QUALITY PROTEIN: TSC22 domain family protein 2 n=1 Tax=Scleropages formosus TaxID=113540 RepID=UPI0010FA7E8B|nr:LOW QUALITY PROTEIN: TSC22 domain family protein 2 [Scleropages formosus]
MSKMPAKKKSCFQITSVTPAQVAAGGATDDTESLEDPDESRTEDVSSDIFDVSRADLEPESCCRSSSEETLNSVADTEAAGAPVGHLPQERQPPALRAPVNGGLGSVPVPHVPGACGDSAPVSCPPTAAPLGVGVAQQSSANVTACTSQQPPPPHPGCSSRFRVIKLDHGSGEPFRRGRWTCTEFYERDSEVITRTVDSIKHGGGAMEYSAGRDSGLGVTGGSVPGGHSAQGPDAAGDGSFAAHAHPAEMQHGYSVGLHGMFQPPGYTAVTGGPQMAVPAPHAGTLPAAPQSLLPPSHNGVQQVQKSPVAPSAPQAQPFAYPAQNLPSLISGTQGDYRQPHLPATSAPVLQTGSLPIHGPPVTQGPSPGITPAAAGPHTLGLVGQTGEVVAGSGGGILAGGQMLPLQPVMGSRGAAATAAPVNVHQTPGVVVPGVPHAPVIGPPLTVPNPTPPVPAGQSFQSQPQVAPGGTGPGLGVQGLQTGVGQIPVNPVEENRRKSEALPQPPVISGKDVMKPLIPESLQLATPSVNSLFGMSIAIDGDEDRNPSTAFYQAFPTSKSRDSKAPGRSASGASVVAIDNKIEQAMDLVKSHLMYAVREEVEVLKEQIKELYERNSVLERENAVLKSLASNDQLSQLSIQLTNPCSSTSPQQPPVNTAPQEISPPMPIPQQPNVSSA